MTNQDQIGRATTKNKICFLIDNLKKDNHFCLALNGEWGSGKTFLLDMVETELKNHEEYIIVRYDAWKNNFYSDPLIAILYCILDTLNDRFILSKKYSKIAKKEFLQLIKSKAIETLNNAIERLYKSNGYKILIAFALEFIKNTIKEAKKSILDNEIFNDFKSYQSLLNDAIIILNAITGYEEYQNKQSKLIVLVDEIDRCLPNEQFIILERLHHLFDVNNCAVICAINKKSIATSYTSQYHNNGNEYLQKFFDYEFALAQNSDLLLKNKFKDFFNRINQKTNNLIEINDQSSIVVYILQIINSNNYTGSPSVYKNNRDITRFFQKFEEIYNSLHIKSNEKYFAFFISVMLINKLIDPNLFKEYLLGKKTIFDFKNAIQTSHIAGIVETGVRKFTYNYKTIEVKQYNLPIILELNYIINLTLMRNEQNSINELNKFYSDINMSSKIDPKEYRAMWEILGKIDNIS